MNTITIITGMSGAGRSIVLKIFEDLGYFCVDNLPPVMLTEFVNICTRKETEIEEVAICVDIRGGKFFGDLFSSLNELRAKNYQIKILFIDAEDETILKRYKESRRNHPLSKNESLQYGIEKERLMLEEIKKQSDYIVNTSHLLTKELREKIIEIFKEGQTYNSMIVKVVSFGFKYGILNEADLVFDVRFANNPYYDLELRNLTGLDQRVFDFVMDSAESHKFLEKSTDLISFLIPNYIREGKSQLVIGVGCTGGKHRSVTFATQIYNFLKINNYYAKLDHRDIEHYYEHY